MAKAGFLPMTRAEMDRRGWDVLDILIVTGDAYVDHPSFGAALLGRWMEAHAYRVGIVAQPRWDDSRDVAQMGRPRLFAGVTAGALDSMLAHYTAFRKKRNDDAYTPGGRAGGRPNRATLVYTGLVRHAFPGLPIVIGGVEASMRRAVHYDFWSDAIRRSILLDSKADLLIYGMAERAILEAADRLRAHPEACAGQDVREARQRLRGIRGTVYLDASDAPPGGPAQDAPEAALALPSYEEILAEPRQLMAATLALERQVHSGAQPATQATGNRVTVFAPPAAPLSTPELDALYALPFTRRPHPAYRQAIPAVAMIQFSVTSHRGCAGGCAFCSIALHQGRRLQSRSAESIEAEVRRLTAGEGWTGSLTDVGGPTANMWGGHCAAPSGRCGRASCLFPAICPHLRVDQSAITVLLRRLARLPGVKHVRVASGVRHDLALRDEAYVGALTREFVGGQLKLAPEHNASGVLRLMRKPPFEAFERFLALFERASRGAGKEQYVVPYLMSGLPGCSDGDMQRLAAWLHRRGWRPQQVQCFVPTPGTVATAMYFAGIDEEGRPIEVARTDAERLRQHDILPSGGSAPTSARTSGRPPRASQAACHGRRGQRGSKIGRRPASTRG